MHAGQDSALGWACGFSQIEVAKVLIAHGADVNATAGADKAFIEEAIEKGRGEVVELLKKHGANTAAEGTREFRKNVQSI